MKLVSLPTPLVTAVTSAGLSAGGSLGAERLGSRRAAWPPPMSTTVHSTLSDCLVAAYRAGSRTRSTASTSAHVRLDRFAQRLLGAASPHAEDVVQEAMLRTSRALKRDDRPIDLRPWLFRVVRNCCLDD